jgi:oligoendopeptidase F
MADMVQQLTGAEEVAWDLSDLYAGDDAGIARELDAVDTRADDFAARLRGQVARLDAAGLLAALKEYEAIQEAFARLASFAQLRWTTNTNDPANGALLQKITERGARFEQKLVFFNLEWAAVEDSKAAALLTDPSLAFYKHYLEAARRYRPHLLTEPEEKILSEKGVTGSSAWTRFFDETLGASRYEFRGEQLSQSSVLKYLYDPDRQTRLDAANSLTAGLRGLARPLTYVFNTLLADKASDDTLRHYPTWVSSRNLANEASDETVNALIEAVTSRYDIVARYYNLKRELLGYDALYEYDRYAPLPSKSETRAYNWNEAKQIVLRGYGQFDEDMAEVAEMFFEKSWIDGPIRPGKRGGAFSAGTVPGVHPYILMNFSGTARDVSTLAHELGHGIHQYMSRERGLLQMHTPLTTAEMASTFGEMLIFNDLLSREDDPKAKLAMLAGKIEDSFATIFRQISMNRFEDAIHTARRTEGEMTTERISELWMNTQRAMFQNSVTLRDEYSIWWSYIQHFLHVPGYVYAYAFGELLVLALYAKYQQEGPSFVPKYVEVLRTGGSDWPHAILSKVGVDLNDPNFWKLGLAEVEKLVAQAEQLAGK